MKRQQYNSQTEQERYSDNQGLAQQIPPSMEAETKRKSELGIAAEYYALYKEVIVDFKYPQDYNSPLQYVLSKSITYEFLKALEEDRQCKVTKIFGSHEKYKHNTPNSCLKFKNNTPFSSQDNNCSRIACIEVEVTTEDASVKIYINTGCVADLFICLGEGYFSDKLPRLALDEGQPFAVLPEYLSKSRSQTSKLSGLLAQVGENLCANTELFEKIAKTFNLDSIDIITYQTYTMTTGRGIQHYTKTISNFQSQPTEDVNDDQPGLADSINQSTRNGAAEIPRLPSHGECHDTAVACAPPLENHEAIHKIEQLEQIEGRPGSQDSSDNEISIHQTPQTNPASNNPATVGLNALPFYHEFLHNHVTTTNERPSAPPLENQVRVERSQQREGELRSHNSIGEQTNVSQAYNPHQKTGNNPNTIFKNNHKGKVKRRQNNDINPEYDSQFCRGFCTLL